MAFTYCHGWTSSQSDRQQGRQNHHYCSHIYNFPWIFFFKHSNLFSTLRFQVRLVLKVLPEWTWANGLFDQHIKSCISMLISCISWIKSFPFHAFHELKLSNNCENFLIKFWSIPFEILSTGAVYCYAKCKSKYNWTTIYYCVNLHNIGM